MRITITCPSCQQRSQIESAHRGRRLKCPYPACKKPFIVGDDGVARLPDAHAAQAAQPVAHGAKVAQVVQPVVETPQVVDWPAPRSEPAEPAHVETVQWTPPPVRRTDETTGFEPPPVRRGDTPSWEPPPVRRPEMMEEPAAAVEDFVVTEAVEDTDSVSHYHAPIRKKRSGLLIIVGIAIVFVISAGLIVFILKAIRESEGKAFGEMVKDYQANKFRQARDKSKQLLDQFPTSDKKPTYEFFHELSDLRDDLTGAVANVAETNDKVVAFVTKWKGKQQYKDYQQDIWESLAALAAAAADKARSTADAGTFDIAKSAVERAKQEGLTIRDQAKVEPRNAELDKKLAQATKAVSMAASRKQILNAIADVMAKQVPGSAEIAQKVHEEHVKLHPELTQDTEVKQRLQALQQTEPEWVTYQEKSPPERLPSGAVAGGSSGTSLLVCPKLKGGAGAAQDGAVVLALDRGVLYGLSQNGGNVRWAMRVGVDTTMLPARVRAGAAQEELALVLSAETNTASAVETKTGETQWHYQLGAPCSAGPILVGRPPMAYLPTEDGKIHVIEPLYGTLRGIYQIGQPLTVPGTYDPISQRLFLPAAHRRIYVMDLQAKRCAGVIYTDHKVGGLRGAPVVAPAPAGQPATLLIAEAQTLDTMKLRPFSVPENVNEARPVQAEDQRAVEFTVPGWSWFMPYFDGDTFGMVTDRGYLALFGLKRGTNDRAVFRVSSQALPVGDAASAAGQRPVGRAQIAAMELGQWWLIVGGLLQPHRFDLYRQQLVRAGADPLPLGIPLQETQSIANGQQLVLVTQALDRAEGIDRSLATCISTATGGILWQRQLGVICAQEPIVLGDHIFAIDKLGGFLHIDAKKAAAQPERPWVTTSEWLSNGADETAVSQLLASADGKSVVAVTFLASSERVRVQKYDLEKGLQPEQVYRLDTPPTGRAALTETSVMVPCRDGTLREFPLAGARELPLPLTWRDPKAGVAVGHAALLSPSQLLISNGLNRLQQWNRGGKSWRKGEDGLELSTGRISTPILVLPGAENDKYLCLGDDANNLHLFSASRLAPLRQWRLDGKITKGPFARGSHIGCVVNGDRLVLLDPNHDTPLWQYPAQGAGQGGGAIVGEPQLCGDQIVVAHLSGHYVWLDPKTGASKAQAAVRSQAIPTTGVVPFGPGRVLSPLSDGTLMIVTPSGS